ncbi:hypothetical protein UFOVP1204_47 [uncultured Caudovirales phage]|uniref:Uncharacterized protein n=1 Tax=uncultured Caudovirales phage TaxID=2100421 RepID=A0A6J5R9H7_9CAUD|nr:hypothetical protein UFOVP473_54 [uncultured Caudovirales phage]CAB4176784.1 hypothetical protein UFOVP983_54 [uncultured Caudovirales phage]CAB4190141.1 hypothetical protein UFOVP1204_47 [uncultured Caudovirales phage]
MNDMSPHSIASIVTRTIAPPMHRINQLIDNDIPAEVRATEQLIRDLVRKVNELTNGHEEILSRHDEDDLCAIIASQTLAKAHGVEVE